MYRGTAGFDADGCPGSGSIDLQGTGSEFSRCLQVSTSVSTRYHFAFRYKGTGNALCGMTFYSNDDGNCESANATSTITDWNTAGDGATWVQGTFNSVAEAGTNRIRVMCQASVGVGAYDQIYLSPTMPPPYF